MFFLKLQIFNSFISFNGRWTGVHPSLTNFFDFCQCCQNYLRHLMVKSYIFQMSGRWFLWHLTGAESIPHKCRRVFFRHIGHSKYRLETWYIQFSRHVGIIKKVLMHIQHFDIFMMLSISNIFRHFAVFGYTKCHKECRNSWFLHRI